MSDDTTITWTVEYIDKSGYKCTLGVQGDDSEKVLGTSAVVIGYIVKHGGQPAPDIASSVAAAATLSPPRPLEEGQHRMLITKLKRDGTAADLYGRGHKYVDLKLFDLTDLGTVGVDFNALPEGQEVPCRFFAVWANSEKMNTAGNPYKDILWLEEAQ